MCHHDQILDSVEAVGQHRGCSPGPCSSYLPAMHDSGDVNLAQRASNINNNPNGGVCVSHADTVKINEMGTPVLHGAPGSNKQISMTISGMDNPSQTDSESDGPSPPRTSRLTGQDRDNFVTKVATRVIRMSRPGAVHAGYNGGNIETSVLSGRKKESKHW